MDQPSSLLPEQVFEIHPLTRGGNISLGAAVAEELRLLLPGRLIGIVLRESGESGEGPALAAARSARTIARRLSRLEVHLGGALPRPETLATLHKRVEPTRHERVDDPPFLLRTSITRVTGTPLVILMITGSGAQLDEDFDQPAALACAEFLKRFQPALTAVAELIRMCREPWAMKDIVVAHRRTERAFGHPSWLAGDDDTRSWDPDAMFLEPFGDGTEERLFRAGLKGRAEAMKFKAHIKGAIESEVEPEISMKHGRARDPGSGAVMPGFGQGREVTEKGLRGRPIVFADGAEGFPGPHEVSGLRPRLVIGKQEHPYPDMLDTLRWLFRTADTPGWVDEGKLGRELERQHFSHQGLRRTGGPAAMFEASTRATHSLLKLIFADHLDDYYFRRMYRRRAGSTWSIVNLPHTISTADYKRLRVRWPVPEIRDRVDTYLLTNTEVLVDDTEPGILQGRRRRHDNAIIYVVLTPDGTGHLGAHDHPVPPLPQKTYFETLLNTMSSRGAALTAPRDDEPDEATQLAAHVAARHRDLDARRRAQQARLRDLDPGHHAALDGTEASLLVSGAPDSPAQTGTSSEKTPHLSATPDDDGVTLDLKEIYNNERQALLEAAATLREQERQLQVLQSQPRHPGLPVQDLWHVVDAATNEKDRRLRIPLLGAQSDFRIYRPGYLGNRGDPAMRDALDPSMAAFALTLTVTDPKAGPRQLRAEGNYPTRYQRTRAGRIRAIIEALAAGEPFRQQAHVNNGDVPDVSRALGGRKPLRVLCITDSQLLIQTMRTCHPILPETDPDLLAPGAPIVGPPLDDDALAALAVEQGWPLALLQQIRRLHLEGTRILGTWLYQRAPATAGLYATARRRRRLTLDTGSRRLLETPRTRLDWDIDGSTVTLIPCPRCGGRRIYTSRLMEAVGGLCQACRQDRNDVRWSRRYDTYLE